MISTPNGDVEVEVWETIEYDNQDGQGDSNTYHWIQENGNN